MKLNDAQKQELTRQVKLINQSPYRWETKAVLQRIAELSPLGYDGKQKGFCYASQEHLYTHLNISRRTLQRHLRRLEQDGALHIDLRAGTNKRNYYRIDFAALVALPRDHRATPLNKYDDQSTVARRLEKLRAEKPSVKKAESRIDGDNQIAPGPDSRSTFDGDNVSNSWRQPLPIVMATTIADPWRQPCRNDGDNLPIWLSHKESKEEVIRERNSEGEKEFHPSSNFAFSKKPTPHEIPSAIFDSDSSMAQMMAALQGKADFVSASIVEFPRSLSVTPSVDSADELMTALHS
jgi:DNA-binding transcriptional ArsR family regulator